MKAISIKQPWASLICEGIKDIENRTWKLPKKYIGQRVLIHAGRTNLLKNVKKYDELLTVNQIKNIYGNKKELEIFGTYLTTGAIIGSVQLVGCEINHTSIWAEKSVGVFAGNTFVHKPEDKPIYNWILASPILFPEPIPAKGKLSFWDYPDIINDNEYFK